MLQWRTAMLLCLLLGGWPRAHCDLEADGERQYHRLLVLLQCLCAGLTGTALYTSHF